MNTVSSLQLDFPQSLVKLNRYLDKTHGRSTIYRACQFLCKFIIAYNGDSPLFSRMKLFENSLGSARKCYALLKILDHSEALARIINTRHMKGSDFAINVLWKVGYLMHSIYDNYSFLCLSGLIEDSELSKKLRRGAVFWMVGLIASIYRDVIKLKQLSEQVESNKSTILATRDDDEKRKAVITLIKDVLDIPVVLGLGKWGNIYFNDQIVGFCGFSSSLLSIMLSWK